MEEPRCKIAAIQMEDPRCIGILRGVVIEMEDPRCRGLLQGVLLSVRPSRWKILGAGTWGSRWKILGAGTWAFGDSGVK